MNPLFEKSRLFKRAISVCKSPPVPEIPIHSILAVVEDGNTRDRTGRWAGFLPTEINHGFAYRARNRGAMDEWTRQFDSTLQIGPEILFHGVLIVAVGCCTGERKVWAEFFTLKLEMFLPV